MANFGATEDMNEYTGDFRREDIFAFCNVEYEEWYAPCSKKAKIAGKVESYFAGYRSFVWPAFFFRSLWFVYRGMIKKAIQIEVINLVLFGIVVLTSLSDDKKVVLAGGFFYLVGLLVYAVVLGFSAARIYGRHIQKCLADRKLEKREKFPCADLKESLKKQGKPSWKRTIGYILVVHYGLYFVVDAMVFTLVRFF